VMYDSLLLLVHLSSDVYFSSSPLVAVAAVQARSESTWCMLVSNRIGAQFSR
jgi:hypothetical protein